MIGGKTVDQIARMDGKNCFVEIMNGMFTPLKKGKFGKILLNFCTYDNSNKLTCRIPIYMDITEALVLINDAKMGFLEQRLNRSIKKAQETNSSYPEAVFRSQGGTSAKILAAKGESRPDGMSEARIFEIIPSSKQADEKGRYVLLRAILGAGEEINNGIIAPRINYKDKSSYKTIQLPVLYEELKGALLLVEMQYQSYLTAQWMKGAFEVQSNVVSYPNNQGNNSHQQRPNTTQAPKPNNYHSNNTQQTPGQNYGQPRGQNNGNTQNGGNQQNNITSFTQKASQYQQNNTQNNNNQSNMFSAQELSDEGDLPFASNN